MHSLRRIARFARPYWGAAALAVGMLVAVTAADLAIPRLVQRIIDQGVAQRDLNIVVSTSLAMIGVSLLSALLLVGNTLLSVRVAQSFGADLRSALFRKVQTLSFGNLDKLQTGQLLVRLTSDVTLVQQIMLMSLRMFTRAPLMIVGSIVLLVVTNARLALLMAVLLPAMMGLIFVFIRRAQPLFLAVQSGLDNLNTVLQENLAGVRVVKAFVRSDHENRRFGVANRDLLASTLEVMRLLAFLMPTMSLLLNLGVVAVLWLGGRQVAHGSLTLGSIVAFVNYLLSTMFPLLMLGMIAGQLSASDASAARIDQVLTSDPDVQDRPTVQPLLSEQGRVVFEDVCFSYDGADCSEPVFQGVSLTAEPGQTVAILGATGSGKSTLVHLIPRFYDVTEGRVMLDGIDVRDISLQSLRSRIAVALQEAVLFSGTIRDNIRYGRPEATDAQVIAAAEAAQSHAFIMALPDGYDTMVGQRGVNLSGGQKQRLAIARALLVQPLVLILDDSTSAVDVETEAKIQAALRGLRNKCTSFVIAQRISTVLSADKIIVLDGGTVAAEGTHSQLIISSPIYQEIYESQLGNGVAYNG